MTDTTPGGQDWGATPDGFRLTIPAGWVVPGSAAIPTDENRDGLKGSLESVPAKIGDLIGAAEIPTPLFAAQGSIGPGTEMGVSVGAYDIGSPVTTGSLRQQLAAAGSDATVDDVTVAAGDGLRLTAPSERPPNPSGVSILAEYWVSIPHHPNQVAIVRFWRRDSEPRSLHDASSAQKISNTKERIVGSFLFLAPVAFWLPLRPVTLRDYAPPQSGENASDGWRFAGFRLGTVYTSKIITEQKQREAEATARPLEGGLISLALLTFIVAIVKLVGFKQGSTFLLISVFSPLGALSLAQKYRWRAVVGYVVVLAILLGVAVALK